MKLSLLITVVAAGFVFSTSETAFGAEKTSLPRTPTAFKAELLALQPPKLVWREIDWNYCLLDGISKARAQKKPILLWAFINSDPAEERC